MSRFHAVNLQGIRAALDHHNANCPLGAKAFLLNPLDHGLLGQDELWGLPVLAVERVPVKRFEIECEASTANLEAELASIVEAQAQRLTPP
jgi:hypothetical protein